MPGPVWDLFLHRVYALNEQDRIDDALDLIYDTIDDLFCAGLFDKCDRLLDSTDAGQLNSDLLVAFLTVTAAARDRLPARQRLAPRIRSALVRLKGEEYTDRLLRKLALPGGSETGRTV